jgi:hypothetical protein
MLNKIKELNSMKHKKEIYKKATKYQPAVYKYRGFKIDSHWDCGRNHWTGSKVSINPVIRFGGWGHTIKDVQEKIDNYLDNQESA